MKRMKVLEAFGRKIYAKRKFSKLKLFIGIS